MQVLVTGGSGFIGHNLVKALLHTGHQVNIIDIIPNDDTRVRALSEMGANYFQGDIRDFDSVLQAGEGCTHVVHLAAQTSVPLSVENPTLNDDININGTQNIIRYVNSNSIKKVVFASSAAVYGNCDLMPLKEESAGDCLSPYAESKFKNERDLLSQVDANSEVHILRFFNVYGPGQGVDSNYAAVIPSFIDKVISGKELTIFGDGKQSRDFVEVSDVVSFIELILSHQRAMPNGVYNVATQNQKTILNLAEIICDSVAKIDDKLTIPKITHLGKRSGDIDHSCADISKAKLAFGWQPEIELERGIMLLVEHELRR